MSNYYVSGCKGQDDDIVTCDDSEAEFWTIYRRDSMGLSQGLVDFTFREDAEAAMKVYEEREALQEQLTATTNSLTNAQEALKSAGIEADTVQAGVMELTQKIAQERIYVRDLNGSVHEWKQRAEAAEDALRGLAQSNFAIAAQRDAIAAQLRAGNAGKDGV
jgi:chromosome segregation ATPase